MTHPTPTDADLQRQAENAGSLDANPAMHPVAASYREIFDVLADRLPIDLPPGFSARVARMAVLAQRNANDRTDRWTLRILLACLAILMVWTCLPAFAWLVSRGPGVNISTGYAAQLLGVLALASLVENIVSGRSGRQFRR